MAAGSDQHLLHVLVNGLLDLAGLLLVSDHQGVQVLAAADLELGDLLVLLHLDAAGVLAGADGEELLQVLDFTRHLCLGGKMDNDFSFFVCVLVQRKDIFIFVCISHSFNWKGCE